MFIPDQFSRKGRGMEPNWFVDTIPTDPLHARRNTAAANTVVLKSSLTAGSRLAGAEFGSGIGESHAAPAAPAFVVRRGQGRPIWHRFAIRASDTFMSGCRHRVLAIRWIAATCRALRVRCSGGGNTEFAGDPFEDEKVVHRGPAHHRHCLPTGISTRGNATDRERSRSLLRASTRTTITTTVAPGSLSVGITLAAGWLTWQPTRCYSVASDDTQRRGHRRMFRTGGRLRPTSGAASSCTRGRLRFAGRR